MDSLAVLLALGATLCWGSTWVLLKLGVDRMDWIGFGVLRPWMGLLIIIPYAAATGALQFPSPYLILTAMFGGLLNIYLGNVLFFYALSRGPLHEATLLSNTSPLWGVLSAVLILGEPARWVTFAAGALVIAGAYFLVRRSKGGRQASEHSIVPRLAALTTGLFWGFSAAVPTKYCLSHGMSPITYQFLFLCGAAIAWSLTAIPGFVKGRFRYTGRVLWIGFGSAFLGLFASWLLWLTALARADASVLSPLYGLAPLLTVMMSVVFLRERPTARTALGGLLVLAGAIMFGLFGCNSGEF